ncbi:MAG: hypothetical protein MUF54_00985, partial [Polyangiaceae bacterium]|nr:hypothetical protein [Polyangiaceae bacterium]
LLGGALALGLAMYFLAPSSPLSLIEDFGQSGAVASQELSDQAVSALSLTTTVFTETIAIDNLKRWQTWLFLYLVLCIGTHIAPSKADFAGSRTGVGALGITLLVAIAIAHLSGETGSSAIQTITHVLMPVVPLFMIAVALNLVTLVAVFAIVLVYRVLKGDSRKLLSRMIAPHWKSLAIVGGICLALFWAVASASKAKPTAGWRGTTTRWIAR